jgi:hypothetical protein
VVLFWLLEPNPLCHSYHAAAAVGQVMLVGDLNLAATAADVHPKIGVDRKYTVEERDFMQQLLADYRDAWRHCHPGAEGVYTCWDEKTSARAFNEVGSVPMCLGVGWGGAGRVRSGRIGSGWGGDLLPAVVAPALCRPPKTEEACVWSATASPPHADAGSADRLCAGH